MEVKTKKKQLEGLPNYIIPPPIALDPDTTLPSAPASPESPEDRDDKICDDFEGDEKDMFN